MTDFLVGADPELFVRNRTTKQFVAAEGLVKGDKMKPEPVRNGAVQVDGMALEFNIDPAHTREEFCRNISSVKRQLAKMIGPDLRLVPRATVTFSDEVWKNVSNFSKVLGCEPDYNVYNNNKPNNRPDGNVNFRTGSGHLHIGWCNGVDIWDPEHIKSVEVVIRQLDVSLGNFSVIVDPDTKRRSLYGMAGSFRPKSYGVEYRVLSNFWLKNTTLTKKVYDITIQSLKDLKAGNYYPYDMGLPSQIAINRSDVRNAKYNFESLSRFNKEVFHV